MSVTEAIMAKLRQLSADDQQRILDAINKLPDAGQAEHLTSPNGTASPEKGSIWARLQAVGKASEELPCDLPADLAVNHDFYLHGLPKRS